MPSAPDVATFSPSAVSALRASRDVHGLDQPVRLLAQEEEIDIKTDDYGAVLLRFDGGVRGLFHVSQVTAGRKNRLTIEIAGSEGSAAWDSESPNQHWLGSRNRPNQVLERDPALISAAAGSISHYPVGHAEGFPETFKQLYLDVYRWIKSGRAAGSPPKFPSFADGDREVRLCEAIGRTPHSTGNGSKSAKRGPPEGGQRQLILNERGGQRS